MILRPVTTDASRSSRTSNSIVTNGRPRRTSFAPIHVVTFTALSTGRTPWNSSSCLARMLPAGIPPIARRSAFRKMIGYTAGGAAPTGRGSPIGPASRSAMSRETGSRYGPMRSPTTRSS